MSEPPTILEWGGGREAFERWLNVFYDLVEQDDLLAPVFGGRVGEEHRRHVTIWWCEVMGGAPEYTQKLGGYEHMLGRHLALDITPEQRLRFVTLLSRAADDADLPADPEFRAAIMGYAEWGTRLALHNSRPGAEVATHAPVPRWTGESRHPTSRNTPVATTTPGETVSLPNAQRTSPTRTNRERRDHLLGAAYHGSSASSS